MPNILIVDDDKDLLDIISLLLSINGYTVKTVSHASETIPAILSFSPDLVLLDVNIGEDDGRDVCKELRLINSLMDIPVILFSAMEGLEEEHIICGATDFLSKPFDSYELIKIVEKNLKVLLDGTILI